MSNKASEPNTLGAANTSDGTANTHEPQNLLDATPRTGSIPLHLGEGDADSGKTQPEKSLNRRILALAVPAFGALIAEPLFVLADSALVGQLGTETLAGMSIAATLITTVVGLMNFLAYSVTPAVARAFGAHRLAHAYRIGVDGVWVALGLGLLIMGVGYIFADPALRGMGANDATIGYARDYLHHSLWGIPPMMMILALMGTLRGLQDTVTPLKVAGVGTVVNVALNWVLIYPVGWGVAGSATGTSLTQWGMALALGIFIHLKMRPQGVTWRPDIAGMRGVLSLGSWLMLRTLSMRLALLSTVFVVARLGDEQTAAYQLGMSVFNLLLFALDSLAIAAQALLGKELGERDLTAESGRAKVRELKNRLVRMSLVYGVVTGVVAPVIGFFGNWIFTQDAPVATLFAWATLVIGVGQPIAAYEFVLDGILMGAQDVKYLAIGSFVMLVVYAPVIFGIHWAVSGGLLSATVGYLGLWAAYILWYQGVRAFIFGRRAASDVWIKA